MGVLVGTPGAELVGLVDELLDSGVVVGLVDKPVVDSGVVVGLVVAAWDEVELEFGPDELAGLELDGKPDGLLVDESPDVDDVGSEDSELDVAEMPLVAVVPGPEAGPEVVAVVALEEAEVELEVAGAEDEGETETVELVDGRPGELDVGVGFGLVSA